MSEGRRGERREEEMKKGGEGVEMCVYVTKDV